MAWIWYLIASLGAGIGTGLAGLSAATVMVPILIVLCPAFLSETGAYQATAIALASDILGSAVTAYTYAKHKNIDLKRGSVMMACILIMCTVGSYAAYLVGNVVLGSFTLFLTFFIGIRFLLKPDTGSKGRAAKGQSLDWKGILISLFFGITIGFGTGFVGTGGGMMMLVVFTLMLGMDHKTAVGTSTFIMTFTALIAAVSHILIHPAIITDKWPVMVFCIIVTTAASLSSARFANRVDSRTVGIVTGWVLTILGLGMLVLNYRHLWYNETLVRDTLLTFRTYLRFITASAASLIFLQGLLRMPKNIFRKLLHIIAFTSSIYLSFKGEGWLAETLTLVIFAVIVYPILYYAEQWKAFSRLLVEKKPGEIRSSLVLLFLSEAVLLAFCCGYLQKRYVLVCSVAAWGLGDIAAAWVGRPLGKHKITLPFADPNKSWEGSIAMAVTSFLTCLLAMRLYSPYALLPATGISLAVGIVSSLTEMASTGGNDTVTVPVANVILMTILTSFI